MTGAIGRLTGGAIGPPPGHPAAYDILVGLHVVCVVIGFGSVALSGVYGGIGRGAGTAGARPESMTELHRFFANDSKLGWFLVAGPAFGVAAMAVRPGGAEFGSLWAVVGMVVWLVAAALLVVVVRPSERRIQRSVASTSGDDPPAPEVELGTACRRLMWAAAAMDAMFVVAVFLMVTQPG